MDSGVGIFWLKVSNIPRGVKLRDMWDTLTEFTPINQILVEDPLPHLGRDCFVQVTHPKSCQTLISASEQHQIAISNTLLHIRESENPENIMPKARDRQKPSQRRIFISHVPRSTRLEEMRFTLVKMVGTCESIKEVRLHPSECPVEHDDHTFQVVTVLFTNCNQVEQIFSGKLDIGQYPLIASCKFSKFLALRIEKPKTNQALVPIESPSPGVRPRALSDLARIERIVTASRSPSWENNQPLAHQMRVDANDHYHRLKPTSSKYFASISKRNKASGGQSLHELSQVYSFNIILPKPR